jgi:uncharacterized protein with FMN-binding domain
MFLNYIMAWIAVLILLILSIKIIIRIYAIKENKLINFFRKLNRHLRKTHIYLGILLIITSITHGIYSGVSILSFNLGTMCLISIMLLGLNYMFRKKIKIKWIKIHRILTIITIILLICHIYDVGGIQILKVLFPKDNTVVINTEDIIEVPYFDNTAILNSGTYEGTSYGYKSNITVSIDIKDNVITSIKVLSIYDDPKYYYQAVNTIPSAIINAQSLDIDTVSGATYSSIGIINAVNEALQKSLVNGTLPELLTLPTKKK